MLDYFADEVTESRIVRQQFESTLKWYPLDIGEQIELLKQENVALQE